MPASQTRSYESMAEFPLLGYTLGAHVTCTLLVEVDDPRKGLVILVGTVLTVTPAVFAAE